MRFRIPALRRDERLKRSLERGLGGNGIRSVSASTSTGTVLILFEPSHPLAEIERRVCEAAARPSAASPEGPAWHSVDTERVLQVLETSRVGLDSRTARARLRRHGPNALASLPRRSGLAVLADQFRSLPVALLVGTAVLSLFTAGMLDAAIVISVVALNGLIGFAGETWTERTIAALETGELPPARALRDGVETALPADRLVPGDVIELRRDDAVPADARVIAADGLAVSEAALTGESMPVAKAANVLAAARAPLAERRNMLLRGSVVVGGSGRAVVVATGEGTEISRVQALLGTAERPPTPLQQQLDMLGRILVFGALSSAVLMLLVGLLRGMRLSALLRPAVSLGVAAIPEGLPTMVTTTLAFDARRLARRGLLVRRFEAIEALGSVRLVCFDKTGTLTLNRMTVTRLKWNGREARLGAQGYRDGGGDALAARADRDLVRLVEVCILCNDAAPGGVAGSATESALLEAAVRFGLDITAIRRERPRLATIERAEGRRYMATLHAGARRRPLVAVKGDPHAVLALCNSCRVGGRTRPLGAARRAAIEADNLEMAEAGLRVLGVAFRQAATGGDLTAAAHDLTWLGLVGMADPIRQGAARLVRDLQRAGIATVMLTGDQRATAAAIAAEAGLSPDGAAEVIEADALDAAPLAPVADRSHRIFARLTPAQKLEVVAGLQRAGMRVAMIGDGVNDTPALKVADVGITLAASATDLARTVADIVLQGGDLAPLAEAFASGRSLHRNIRRAIRFLVATNLSEIMLMLFATGTGLVRPLSPGQLLWINLLTDVLPAMGIALEPADPNAMERAPDRPPRLLAGRDLGIVARDAGVIAGNAVLAEAWAARRRGPEAGAAAGFASLVSGQLCYALACRLGAPLLPGPPLAATLALSFAAQGALLLLPATRRLAGPLGAGGLALASASGLLPLALVRALAAGDPVQ